MMNINELYNIYGQEINNTNLFMRSIGFEYIDELCDSRYKPDEYDDRIILKTQLLCSKDVSNKVHNISIEIQYLNGMEYSRSDESRYDGFEVVFEYNVFNNSSNGDCKTYRAIKYLMPQEVDKISEFIKQEYSNIYGVMNI